MCTVAIDMCTVLSLQWQPPLLGQWIYCCSGASSELVWAFSRAIL
jgi:hypothetical protein